MARIFEYLECPQYLRKDIFPIHESLKYAGLLNPLDAMHHLRSTNLELPYREGIVLDKSTKDGQQLCNVGLDRVNFN
jgi:methyltransferase